MIKNKSKIIAVTSVGALGVLGLGAFAFFGDKIDQETSGTIGTVDIKVPTGKDLALTNNKNINPGDEDPLKPYDPTNPGASNTTPHELSFSIKNDGTKSIRTRNIIDIVVTDQKGVNLDPLMFVLYEKGNDNINKELSALNDLGVSKFTYQKDGKTILRYIVEGASLNGITDHLEDGDVATNDVVRPSVSVDNLVNTVNYKYFLGLKPIATDTYQGANVTINLTVQAMQYRNTSTGDNHEVDGDWKTVFEDTISTN